MDDKKIIENCIYFLELQKQHHAATFEIEKCISWLEKQKLNMNAYTCTHAHKPECIRGRHSHPNRSTEVVQIRLKSMDEIARFKSIYEAYIKTGARNISACCKKLAKSSGGYAWMYAKEYDELMQML